MTIDVAPEVEVSGDARHAHDGGWVSEFEAFQWSEKSSRKSNGGDLSHAAPTSARSGRSVGARSKAGGPADPNQGMDNLRAEIKLLHWHKLANEAALKAALLKTKKIKAQGGRTTRPVPAMTTLAMPTGERAAWMQQVIEEEQSKPLRVSKDFMSKYEEQEKENEGRLDSEVAAHIRGLRALRKKVGCYYIPGTVELRIGFAFCAWAHCMRVCRIICIGQRPIHEKYGGGGGWFMRCAVRK